MSEFETNPDDKYGAEGADGDKVNGTEVVVPAALAVANPMHR